MKIGYEFEFFTSRNLEQPFPSLRAQNCRGRCYLPRSGSRFSSSRLSPQIQLGFRCNRPKDDTYFAVNTKPGQGCSIRVIQANPRKSNFIFFSLPGSSLVTQLSSRLQPRHPCHTGTSCVAEVGGLICEQFSPPFALFAPFAVKFPVKPGQAQSRHNRVNLNLDPTKSNLIQDKNPADRSPEAPINRAQPSPIPVNPA